MADRFINSSDDFDSGNIPDYIMELDESVKNYCLWKISDANRQAKRIINEARIESESILSDTDGEIKSRLWDLKQQEKQLKRRAKEIEYQNRMMETKVSNFPEIAEFVAAIATAEDIAITKRLKSKNHPALRAAEEVKNISQEKRELIKQLKALEWEMKYFRRLIPWLDEIEDSPMEPVNPTLDCQNPYYNSDGVESTDVDNAGYWLTPQEYRELPITDKNQLALDRYKKRRKTNSEIGREYERYIGYLFCKKGCTVEYTGIQNGLNDLGRDLVCKCGNVIYVVQCKCWSNAQGKIIHEKHINQLYGTAMMYVIEHNKRHPRNQLMLGRDEDLFNRCVIPRFVSTVPFSDTAKDFAEALGIELDQILYEDYPMIKCNVSDNGEQIYHLPFDQMYDKIDMSKQGTRYAMTVEEAESLGFRRAKRWLGN